MIIFTSPALYQIGFQYNVVLPAILSSRILLHLRASEKAREDLVDVQGLPVEQWQTMFRIT